MKDYIQFKTNYIKGKEVTILAKGNAKKFMFTDLIETGHNNKPTNYEIYFRELSITDNVNYLKKLLLQFFQESIPIIMIKDYSEFINNTIFYVFDLLNQKQFNSNDISTVNFQFGLKFPKPIDLDCIEVKCSSLSKTSNPKFNLEFIPQQQNIIDKNTKCSYLSMQIQVL